MKTGRFVKKGTGKSTGKKGRLVKKQAPKKTRGSRYA